jgi:hypothetical protein
VTHVRHDLHAPRFGQLIIGQCRQRLLCLLARARRGPYRRGAESNLVIFVAKARTRAEQERLNPSGRRPQRPGDLRVAQASDLAHGQGGTVRGCQAFQGDVDRVPLLRGQAHRLGRRPARRVGVGRSHGLAQLGLRKAPAPAQRAQACVRGNAREPSTKGVWLAQRGQRAQRLQEGLLRNVFGLRTIAQELVGQRVDAWGVPIEESGERISVSAQ